MSEITPVPNLNRLLDRLEDEGKLTDEQAVLDTFTEWAQLTGRPLYPHQADAALEICAGNHVIAATPTGSGKTMIALAAHFAALARDERSYYTAPLKALVSEKFFDLVALFGPHNVGMITGDISVNADAPIICCTAEILANQSLQEGSDLDCGCVIMDEFHFYSDRERGWAWQVPLLELKNTQFVLLSATLGDTSFFQRELAERTGRPVALIDNAERPVPLVMHYSYEETLPLLKRLIEEQKAPIYLVHFSQKQASNAAADLAGAGLASKAQRELIAKELADVKFGSGYGKVLSRLLRLGIGVHHAGMLPRYRRLVEKLAAAGALAVICGTDTLGVGINVPIRTVVITSLVKFDGSNSRHLSAREFHQIAGRAGRAGYDTVGYVEVQCPPEDYGKAPADEKDVITSSPTFPAAAPKAKKKKPKQSTPKTNLDGTKRISWGVGTFERLVAASPEPLKSRFKIDHSTVLNVLSGSRDGQSHLLYLAQHNHDILAAPVSRNPHLRQLGQVYKSLRQAGVVTHLPSTLVDESDLPGKGRLRLVHNLPTDFALNQPLAPFALAALDLLEPESPEYALDLISLVESVLEDPWQVLYAQQRIERDKVFSQLKQQGVEYNQRQELLDEVTYPQPLKQLIDTAFTTYRVSNPWVLGNEPSPKSVVRYMIENSLTFSELISRLDLARAEGAVLRYLTDAYKAAAQIVSPERRDEVFEQVMTWLHDTIRNVDSSLLDEWERLAEGNFETVDANLTADDEAEYAFGAGPGQSWRSNPFAVVKQSRQLMQRLLTTFAKDRCEQLEQLGLCDIQGQGWTADDWQDALDEYWNEFEHLRLDATAGSPEQCRVFWGEDCLDLASYLSGSALEAVRNDPERWLGIEQLADDTFDSWDWRFVGLIDLKSSEEISAPVLRLEYVGFAK